jgi:hypothetical protein
MVAKVRSRLVYQSEVPRFIELPKFGFSLPGLKMNIPHRLPMCILNAQASLADFLGVPHLARIGIDVVNAKVAD